ncbi:MAG TPA: hypothetical protein VHA73_14760 [Acidimicrobiales bacterium]|jgi:hypothetical protein|nr:hypothetical protein [Acidimicrobiales bacterium]
MTLRGDARDAARAESAWVALGDAYSAFQGGSHGHAADRLGDALDHAGGVDLLADDLVVHGHDADQVATFSAWLAETADRPSGIAAARLIESRQAEAAGDVDRADALVREALEADPDCAPARWDAAWHAALRDDYDDALEHLARLGVPADDADVQHWTLASAWRDGRHGVASPCQCGSGRHQKRCCGKDGMELHLLWWKLRSFLFRAAQRGLVLNVAAALTGLHAGDVDLEEQLESPAFEQALVHPLTATLAVVPGGLAAHYRDVWGDHATAVEQRLLDLIASARVDVWVIPEKGHQDVRSLDGRSTVRLRNEGVLAAAGAEPGCVVAAVTGDGAKSDAYLVGVPTRLRAAPVEGPPIEVAELFHQASSAEEVIALASALAPYVDLSAADATDVDEEPEADTSAAADGSFHRGEHDERTDDEDHMEIPR